MLTLQADAPLDVLQVVSVWFPDLFPDHVRKHDIPDLSGSDRRCLTAGDHQAVLDVPCPMGLDLYGRYSR